MLPTKPQPQRGRYRFLFWVGAVVLLPLGSQARTPGLTAIEVYPASGGDPGYMQISDFVLNGKNEVYLCPSGGEIDKSSYHKLGRVTLAPGMSLERDAQGVLLLTSGAAGAAPVCAVPGNLKLDKGDASSPAALADRAEIVGKVLPDSDPAAVQIAPLKAGVQLFFVPAANQEMAEYLRARRRNTMAGWNDYLGKYRTGANATPARKALASLYIDAASADLQAYETSKGSTAPDYGKLREARKMVNEARAVTPDPATVTDLDQKVHQDVLTLSAQSREQLQSYRRALSEQKPGYVSLVAAENLARAAADVEPSTAEAVQATEDARKERTAFDSVLRETEARLAARNPDEAVRSLSPVRAFATENPRIADDLKATSTLYLLHARELQAANNWAQAVSELQKAQSILPSADTLALLKKAQAQATIAANKAAAAAALQESQNYEASGNILDAFEVVDDLSPEQRALVADRLDALKDKYVEAADAQAKTLQKAHEPVTALSDETGIQKAYAYLQRCYRLTSDPALQDRIAVLGDDLSAWYLQQGKKFVEKPDGSGVNVGWTYLTEALEYNSPTTAGQVRDLMTTVGPAHRLKSRLSIRVDFRDQTSRRDAPAFPTQLSDALATGLDSSGIMVTIIRPGDATPVQPNFQLIGDVLRHDLGKSQEVIPKESKYRSGEQEIPNEAWNEANREYEKANLDLDNARSILQGAETRGKKKEIEDAKKSVADTQEKVEEMHEKLDAIPRTKSVAIERPYTYTQVVNHVQPVVELQFRILNSVSDEVVPTIRVHREAPEQYTVLENVKPEDTQGVRAEGTIPNEQAFYEKAEYGARDELIDQAKSRVSQLPAIVLAGADRKAAQGDEDGAAELYILYLNSTRDEDTPERIRAKKFLEQSFNFTTTPRDAPSA